MEPEPGKRRPSNPHYLSIWSDEARDPEELIAQTLGLLSAARRVLLIYEEMEGRAHHSETPVTSPGLLSSMVRQMATEAVFRVLSDLETFALIPIAANEFVIIHDGSVAFNATGAVRSTDSTGTYGDGDWFAFLQPELAMIMAT